jgi:phosphoribosylformylglycinamidine synthase
MSVRALIICGFGFNSQAELAEAFRISGAEPELIHVTDVIENPKRIHDAQIIGFPGGFSFGDHLGSGKEIANLLRAFVKPELEKFVENGKPVIGICNGFQVITKLGIVPNLSGGSTSWEPQASLIHNESGTFMDKWVEVSFDPQSPCVWTRGLEKRELPIRHGEGRFVAEEAILDRLEREHLVAVRYSNGNPNGSARDIAGITDSTGLVLGLMPHPECFLFPENHPRWQRESVRLTGVDIIRQGVNYIK